jgi:glyoxylase-like metal-dependent hydrolase (beta-lactamase superfamily II)
MAIPQWNVGSIVIRKLVEFEFAGPVDNSLADSLDGASAEAILAVPWLKPMWLNDANEVTSGVHSFLIETPSQRLIVDTGVGNHKPRAAAFFNQLDTDFLRRLDEQAGWPADTVTGVICTHLHVDHVGWNTVLVAGEWVPTFQNANYYFVARDYEHWQAYAQDPAAAKAYRTQWARDMVDGAAVFNDSVQPVVAAGKARLVEPDAVITPGVRLLPSPGHTPGHACVLIESEGESAIITGDMMHSIFQIAHPDWSSVLDTDPDIARRTRQRFLSEWADKGTLMLGSHFGPPTGGELRRHGTSYQLA